MNAPGRAVKASAATNSHLLVETTIGEVPCHSSGGWEDEDRWGTLRLFVKMLNGASKTHISLKPSHLQCQQSLSLPAQEGLEQAGSSCWSGCARALPPSTISGGTGSQAGSAMGKINYKRTSQKESGEGKKYYKIQIEKIQSESKVSSWSSLPLSAVSLQRGTCTTLHCQCKGEYLTLSCLGKAFHTSGSLGLLSQYFPNLKSQRVSLTFRNQTKRKKEQSSRFHGLSSSLPPNMQMKVHQRAVKDIITKPHAQKYRENTALFHTVNTACSQRPQAFTFSNESISSTEISG